MTAKVAIESVHAVDHLVVAAPSFDLACEYVADTVGVPPIAGGAHPGRGTRNALLGLGSGCYLEAIGPDPDQADPRQPRAFGIDDLSEARLVTWALRARNLEAVIARCPSTPYSRPSAMSRRLADGALLEWQLAFPASENGASEVVTAPFLIDWGRSLSPGFTLVPSAQIRSLEVDSSDDVAAVLLAAAVPPADELGQEGVELRLRPGAPGALRATIKTEWGTRLLSS